MRAPIENLLLIAALLILATSTLAGTDDDVQVMSDPLAVYTQLGLGYTDKGLNLKAGKSYDSGKEATMAMNVFEIKGMLGEALGWRDNAVNSIDSFRFRNFKVDMTDGRGTQIDATWNRNTNSGSASYSLMQALPPLSLFNLYPLAGLGIAYAGNVDEHPLWSDDSSPSGLSIPGAFWMAGMYAKITVTKKIWLNYNPVFMQAMAGSPGYMDNAYGMGENSVYAHEAAVSYQINPRMNVRYFANWTTELDYADGDHRIEVNYQF